MPQMKTLRVRRKGTAMVPHYEHPHVRRFVGHRHDPMAGEDFEDFETKQVKRQGGFVGHDEVVEVPNTVEYRRHISVDKDLWAADLATAQECGVAFDPNFGEPAPKSTSKDVKEH